MAQILINEGAVPATPATGKVTVYAKADGLLYSKDDAGIETAVSGAARGANTDITSLTGLTGAISGATTLTTTGNATLGDSGTDTHIIRGSVNFTDITTGNVHTQLSGSYTGNTAKTGINIVPTMLSDVTLEATMFRSAPSTQADTFTLPTLHHFRALQGTIGAGSTISVQNGFNAASTLTGAGTNRGFSGDIPAGANNYNLYMGGTAKNYLAGATGIGITPDTTRNNCSIQTGNGIGFPVTQVASTDPNTLDDYEEGTWTPTFVLDVPGTSSFTYSTQQGTYTKIGRLVTCAFSLACSAASAGTGTGFLKIAGFPFTSSATTMTFFGGAIGFGAGFTTTQPLSSLNVAATTTARLYNTGSALMAANIGATQQVIGTILFEV